MRGQGNAGMMGQVQRLPEPPPRREDHAMNEATTGFRVLEFNKGQLIFKEGQSGRQAFLVRTGSVTIFRVQNGVKSRLARLRAGEIFGEMAVITGEPRSASAEAAEFTELVVIDEQSLHGVLSHMVPVAQVMLRQIITRFRELIQAGSGDAGRERSMETALESIRDNARLLERHLQGKADPEGERLCSRIVAACSSGSR